MKSKKLGKQILLFTFKTQKEIALTFCRVEEFYESPLKALVDKKFSHYEFLDAQMNDKGEINYFSYWSGFNIPGDYCTKWWNAQEVGTFSSKEIELFNHINEKLDTSKPYYIIGALEKDSEVMDHEIAHALFYLNEDFKTEMLELVYDFYKTNRKEYSKMVKKLKVMGYNEKVIRDEIQAYMSTSKKKELVEKFCMDYDTIKPYLTQFRKTLLKYNTFKK